MIIMDLEWNSGYDKTPLEEILQIGAVRVDAPGGRITDTFSVFIHPCVHRKMNRTAKALPELQSSLDSPLDFPAALNAFVSWCGNDTVFADWGGDDFAVLRQNCDFWHVAPPAFTQLLDLQAAFSIEAGTSQGIALYRAVEYCGIPTPFTFHNALHDAVYTAVISAWISRNSFTLLALPKEIRRLMNAPAFPPQPVRRTDGYITLQSALNSRGCRRQTCPLCGESVWVRRWYPIESRRYFADFRCKTHGSFLCRLDFASGDSCKWYGSISVPEVTPALLQEFDSAIGRGAIVCKGGVRRKKTPRRFSRRQTAHTEK